MTTSSEVRTTNSWWYDIISYRQECLRITNLCLLLYILYGDALPLIKGVAPLFLLTYK
jgi:hypothetical protein